jgi:hypothetical protein
MNDDHCQSIGFAQNDAMASSSTNRVRHDDQEAIDQALRLVADHHAALGVELDQGKTIGSLIALRQSPLGRKLRRLAVAARGGQDVDLAGVRADADAVIALLLQPLAATEYRVPTWFWQTSLGELLASAIHRTYTTDQLLCLGSAAERLDEDQATIERWVADGTLTAVRDETGKTFIPVKQIEHFRIVARTFDGPSGPPADSLVATRAA